ncbi:hypothetical protein AMECASPLE_033254 [Ameca splendens]|uniref:Uncharacterized protein n=1 Tax=Ameca splendens TaxID=208324 RepID=A0ABV0ZSA6_9TELE
MFPHQWGNSYFPPLQGRVPSATSEGFAAGLHLIKTSVLSVCGNDGHSKAIFVIKLQKWPNGLKCSTLDL